MCKHKTNVQFLHFVDNLHSEDSITVFPILYKTCFEQMPH